MKNGYSLIELLIVVGIIGILSLMAIPTYKDYVTKVKLTELVTRHLYLLRQLDIEFIDNNAKGVYEYMQGMCSSDIKKTEYEEIPGAAFLQCETNAGLFANSELNIQILGSDSSAALVSISSSYATQSFWLDGYKVRAPTSKLLYFPENRESSAPFFWFYFTKNEENTPWYSRLQIEHNGDTVDAPPGHWHCAMFLRTESGDELAPKSIRPSACSKYYPIYEKYFIDIE